MAVFLLLEQPLYAQETFSFQGRLTGPDGTSVNDGTYSVRFQLFDEATGGSPLWEEAHTVMTEGGIFSALLGAETPLELDAFETMPYLALTVDGVVMEPRVLLTSVPYAMKSYRLDEAALVAGQNVTITQRADGTLQIGATGGGTGGLTSVARDGTLTGNGTSGSPLGLADGSVTSVKIVNGTVTGAKIADGAVTGEKLSNDALLAGQNVTITRHAGGALEVSATGGGGGLLQVTSDATLEGDGTAGAPLALNIPLALTHSGNAAVIAATSVNGNIARFASADQGVYGQNHSGHYGYLGGPGIGAYGAHSNGNFGQLGTSSFGVRGESTSGAGIRGFSASGSGVLGSSDSGFGVRGSSTSGAGIQGSSVSDYGVFGASNSSFGVYGEHNSSGNWGALGTSSYGGAFNGDVIVLGTLIKSSGSFKIDHPLDPANKYLSHSFVESPDMMNVYNGNVVLNAAGEAVVTLPDYFETLNRDFRYQLTPIGAPGPNLYIVEEISGNTFKIAGGMPGMKVSWLVTGIRQDVWANEHRIVVEEDKKPEERGYYLHPKLFGQPEEQNLMRARGPEGILRETPTRVEEEQRPRRP